MLLLVTGCWDKDELNELGIALALGIDMQGDLYKVSAQVVLPTEIASKSRSGGNGNAVTVYDATAPTLYEAIRKLIETSPRVLYIPQLRVVVLGEDYARRGISNMVETLMRDVFARTDYFVVVAKGAKAEDILQVSTPLERIPANQVYSSLLASSKTWAPTSTVTIDELMKRLVTEGVEAVLTGIQIVRSTPPAGDDENNNLEPIKPRTELRVSSLAVFDNDRLIGWLNEEESKGYNYIRDQVNQSFGHIAYGNGLVGVRILQSTTDVKAKIINGEPHIQIKVTNMNAIVEMGTTELSLRSREDYRRIEQECSDSVVHILQNTCDVLQHKFKVDIFGFGSLIHQTHPKVWKTLKQDWSKTFSGLKIDLSADVHVKRVGQLGDNYLKQMRENTK